MLRRRRIVIAARPLVAGIALLFVPLLVIRVDTGGRLTSDPADVYHHQVALVLGAGLTADRTPTWFLADRLDAAIRLYRMGTVDGLLMSGDNHTASHDEPTAMRTYAIAPAYRRPPSPSTTPVSTRTTPATGRATSSECRAPSW
jgi:vancomycin permeability regulator SanA